MRNAYYLQDVIHSVHLIYVARLYGVLPCSAYLSDREHMSQPIIVKQMTYANSVPVPAEVEKLNQKFHPASNEKAFNKGELMRYARNSSTLLSIN